LGELRHPRLGLLQTLGEQRGLFAEVGRLARVREVQQNQDSQSDGRRKPGVGADRGDEVVHREGE
jgi:hypothetical protein